MGGASAASCFCSFLVWQQPNQDQELSRRDGASHLSLLVQRNLAQRKHTPPPRPVRCTGSAEGPRRSRSTATATAVGRAYVPDMLLAPRPRCPGSTTAIGTSRYAIPTISAIPRNAIEIQALKSDRFGRISLMRGAGGAFVRRETGRAHV